MPNPRSAGRHLDLPLDQAVGYATHIRITCRPPIGVGYNSCGRYVIWQTSELYAKLPKCRTMADFRERLVCSKCNLRGWVSIEPEGR